MSAVGIDFYNSLDARARVAASNRILAAINPITFQNIGYPTHITERREAFKYFDVMHENRFESDFTNLLDGALSESEWALWQEIYLRLKRAPRASLCRAQYMFRAIADRLKPPATVVEIGPGSGYLSTLLCFAGYTVIPIEITQAFYIWQSILYSTLFHDKYHPIVSAPRARGAHIYHVPWWAFYRNDFEELAWWKIDLVTANHVLSEMTQDALCYVARLCETWKSPLLFEGIGLQRFANQTGKLESTISITELMGKYPTRDPGVDIFAVQAFIRENNFAEQTLDEKFLTFLYGKDHYS